MPTNGNTSALQADAATDIHVLLRIAARMWVDANPDYIAYLRTNELAGTSDMAPFLSLAERAITQAVHG
jgi:hypothetical protein